MSEINDNASGVPVEGTGDSGGEPQERSAASILAEVNRRDQRNQKSIEELNSQLASINQALSQLRQPAGAPTPQVDLAELAYKDPAAFAQAVEDRVNRKVDQTINAVTQRTQLSNQVLNQMVSDYPELSDSSSELTKRATDLYSRLTPQQQADPNYYKVAIRDAAAELGVMVKSKRPVSNNNGDDGSYTGGGSSSSNSASRDNRRRSTEPELSEATLAFAELSGLNTKDPKVIASLKQRATRKKWTKYE